MTALAAVDPTPLVQRLSGELERMPASRAAALRTLRVADDPQTSAADLAAAASLDPALTARVLRLANSAYYGLSGRVGNAAFAVTVVGFSTVRSLAAVAAAGLGGPGELPGGFWHRATAVASASSLVGPRVGAGVPEAFCAGLLHDLGDALLQAHDPAAHAAVACAIAARPGRWARVREEVRAYGGTHADLGAQVLRGWWFPNELCSAIAGHHAPASRAHPPLLRALLAALVLADLADDAERTSERSRPDAAQADVLAAAQVPPGALAGLVAQVVEARNELTRAVAS